MIIRSVLILILLAATLAPASAQNKDICNTQNTVFEAGEVLTYKLYYNWNFVWLAAGEVTFKVHDLPNQYHVIVNGKTYPSYEWFFKVDDYYQSYLNKETLLPEIHIKDITEGGYQRYDRTVFDQGNSTAISHRGKRYNSELREKTIDFEGCMHDLISIIYYTRNLDVSTLAVDEEIPIEILMDQKIYPLAIKYLGDEDEKTVKDLGDFRVKKFSPQLIAGEVFKEGDEMKIWISDDKNKIPLLIESPVVVGSVKAVLKSHKGLKYPLSSRIE